MPNTYTLIERITVGAAGASSITFTSIPQTYTDLVVKASVRSNYNSTWDNFDIAFNGVTTNLSAKRLIGDGAAASSGSTTNIYSGANAATSTASTFSSYEVYIPNYTSSDYKSVSYDGVSEQNATTAYAALLAGLWSSTAAITSITLSSRAAQNWSQYSTFYLYGIAKEGVSPSPSSAPYATGGDSIVFDGTYWIHTFRSSGTFTPKKALTCDYLVVAGGGSGGCWIGAGGGAGGLRSTVTATGGGGSLESALSLANGTAYTVTVGAGAASVNTSSTRGNNGSNSSISGTGITTITSTGGGGGGAYNALTGNNGGSGGGGGYGAAGGTGTTNQGYAGGTGVGAFNFCSAGGGGAGTAGANASTANNNGASGGNGVAVSITGSSVTYAGGGGGGTNSGYEGSGGSGGGGASGFGGGVAGTANTGGGGGGAGNQNTASGAGGSGIVIVRYAA